MTTWPVSITLDNLHAPFRFRLRTAAGADRKRTDSAPRRIAHVGAGPANRPVPRLHLPKLSEFLKPSDVLVLNDTRVIRARIYGSLERASGTSRQVEVLFAAPVRENTWEVMCRRENASGQGTESYSETGSFEASFW